MFYYDNYIVPSIYFNPEENIVPLDQWEQPEFELIQANFWLSGEKMVAIMMEAKDSG